MIWYETINICISYRATGVLACTVVCTVAANVKAKPRARQTLVSDNGHTLTKAVTRRVPVANGYPPFLGRKHPGTRGYLDPGYSGSTRHFTLRIAGMETYHPRNQVPWMVLCTCSLFAARCNLGSGPRSLRNSRLRIPLR